MGMFCATVQPAAGWWMFDSYWCMSACWFPSRVLLCNSSFKHCPDLMQKSITPEQAMLTHTKKNPAGRKKDIEPAITEVRVVPNNLNTIHLINTEFFISITLTAAAICRGDHHDRWFMFCNDDSKVELERKCILLHEHNITDRRGGKRREKNPNLCWVMISTRGWPEFKHTGTHPQFVPLFSE